MGILGRMGWNKTPDEEDSMSMQRRHFTTDQKATILQRCLVDKTPLSDLCDEYDIKPNPIYAWPKILVDNLEAIFHPTAKRAARRKSLLRATVSWPRPAIAERSNARRHVYGRLPDARKSCAMTNGLGGG
jgi:transposase